MRRMLTDKLTKSIKEVVNAYNEGEFSAVSANPVTTTETLTSIEIDGTGYAIESGSSVEIDNKTIIQNLDGELETAVGGWKEESVVSLPDCELTGTYDFDEYDSEKAQTLYDSLEVNVEYPCSVTFTNMQTTSTWTESTFTVTGYIKSASKDSSKYGGDPALFVTYNDNEYGMEFYVEPSSNRIHVYGGNVGLYPDSNGGTVAIDLGDVTVTTYHKIDSRYLDVTEYQAGFGIQLNDSTISVKATNWSYNPVVVFDGGSDNFGYRLNYNKSTLRTDRIDDEDRLTTQIGGGYNTKVAFNNTYLTVDPDTNYSTYTESKAVKDAVNLVKNYLINERLSDLVANAAFSYKIYTSFAFEYSDSGRSPVMGLWVTVDNTGNLVSFEAAGGSSEEDLAVKGSFELDTLENVTEDNITTKFDLTGCQNIKFDDENHLAWYDDVIAIDNKFIPAINQVPTVAGTYTLQVTVDASGNPTFTWVAANV